MICLCYYVILCHSVSSVFVLNHVAGGSPCLSIFDQQTLWGTPQTCCFDPSRRLRVTCRIWSWKKCKVSGMTWCERSRWGFRDSHGFPTESNGSPGWVGWYQHLHRTCASIEMCSVSCFFYICGSLSCSWLTSGRIDKSMNIPCMEQHIWVYTCMYIHQHLYYYT